MPALQKLGDTAPIMRSLLWFPGGAVLLIAACGYIQPREPEVVNWTETNYKEAVDLARQVRPGQDGTEFGMQIHDRSTRIMRAAIQGEGGWFHPDPIVVFDATCPLRLVGYVASKWDHDERYRADSVSFSPLCTYGVSNRYAGLVVFEVRRTRESSDSNAVLDLISADVPPHLRDFLYRLDIRYTGSLQAQSFEASARDQPVSWECRATLVALRSL